MNLEWGSSDIKKGRLAEASVGDGGRISVNLPLSLCLCLFLSLSISVSLCLANVAGCAARRGVVGEAMNSRRRHGCLDKFLAQR
ncbi:unnamed protein product [Prunus armeniaca]|uniref:Uncharacterized protein n=1 Tax=Prunus armeniaca TaxID=36596 RepID=A0A6J5TXJ9_PRUAR|nr:unnamed protein product [Prunus armeniaca]